jgi:hypothetical protein
VGLSWQTLHTGMKDLDAPPTTDGRIRRPGAGRKSLRERDPELEAALDALVVLQRKVLTPAVADSLAELKTRILAFEAEYRRQPRPVRWKFTRQEFDRRLRELEQSTLRLAA